MCDRQIKFRAPRLSALAIAAISAVALAACGSTSHAAQGSHGTAAYQLHMSFFSHESGLKIVIDPQVFVRKAGAARAVGPQMITHAAGLAPAPQDAPASSSLRGATGAALGITLGEWERARGSLRISCASSRSTVDSTLTGLIPHGVYSVFVVHLRIDGPGRFTPLGNAAGTNNNFVASSSGTASSRDTVSGCLTRAEAVVVIWHSDAKTHGKIPGLLGVTWHNSLIAPLT